MKPFAVRDLGVQAYPSVVEFQRETLETVIQGDPETLILVEHPPILTLGADFHPENLLHAADWYRLNGIDLLKTDRGGDVTYHAPGQLVVYPIFSLESRGRDLHRWLRDLEGVVIEVIGEFGVVGTRRPPHTGVWVGDRKICAIGIKVRRWVSMHGLALNCNLDLQPFKTIIPCGIHGLGVTSLSAETERDVSTSEVKPVLVDRFRSFFG